MAMVMSCGIDAKTFNYRSRLLRAAIVFWAAMVVAFLFYFSCWAGAEYRHLGWSMAWRRGVIPAPRGRIIDGNGRVLAWTETRYKLRPRSNDAVSEELSIKLGKPRYDADGRYWLLPKEAMTEFNPSIMAAGWDVKPKFFRRSVGGRLDEIIGGVVPTVGGFAGISGLEALHDRALRGEDGIYRVMRDKRGDWIDGTWRWEREMKPGGDVTVEVECDND